MGNGHEMKNQPVKQCFMEKERCDRILGRSTETFTVTNVCCAHLAMMSMEFLNILYQNTMNGTPKCQKKQMIKKAELYTQDAYKVYTDKIVDMIVCTTAKKQVEEKKAQERKQMKCKHEPSTSPEEEDTDTKQSDSVPPKKRKEKITN